MTIRIVIVFILTTYLGLTLLSAPLSIWLLFKAQTWIGFGLAVSGLMAVTVPLTCFLTYRRSAPRYLWRWGSLTLVISLLTIAGLILLNTPSGQPPAGSPARQRFTRTTTFSRYALTNIIPEVEQINLGFLLMTIVDPYLDVAQSRRVAPLTFDLYREMESDPNFHELGSAMGWAYAELLDQPFEAGHYYLYVPKNRPQGPLPALIFLHGSAGNFKVYFWLWSKLAEEEGMVIIAPSFGFGNWRPPASIKAVLVALDDAGRVVDIDPSRVYLAGLSNGGLGVSQLAQAAPERFQGLIFLSPVMATEIVDSVAFQSTWRNRPALVISGATDRRVPIAYVSRRIANLQTGGLTVTPIIYPDEDHFLFFSQAESVLNDVAAWLIQIE